MSRVLLIDNYDSFSYNLVQAFRLLGAEVSVFRNDTTSVQSLLKTDPTHVVLSPGPGSPKDAGCCIPLLLAVLGRLPILGVCLGHQCLAQALGGHITRADLAIHGKASPVRHDETGLFQGCSNPMKVGRYHSLVADPSSLPHHLDVTAKTSDGQIMAVEHVTAQAYGVQFHPELSQNNGLKLIKNFLNNF